MTNLQTSDTGRLTTTASRRPSRPSWLTTARGWWKRGGRAPLVLHRVVPPAGVTHAGQPDRPTVAETSVLIARAALQRPGGLMNAYVASAVDIALEAEALCDGAPVRRVRLPLHDLVAEVSEALQPCARAAGATLVHDRHSRWACVVATDPTRLRKAMQYLILRALSGQGHAGAVRIMVVSEPGAARVTVTAMGRGPDPGLFDLAALTRVVEAIGGVLAVGPEQAGVTPVAIQLPTPSPAPLGLGDGDILFGRRA